MKPTKYKNLYRTDGLFQYVYAEDNFKIEARDWNDLKFKLALSKIKLQEKTDDEKDKITVKRISNENKTIKSKTPKVNSNKKEYKNEPLKKNKDYIDSEDDVNFGKIVRPGEIERWGPDNSERARKLRRDLIR